MSPSTKHRVLLVDDDPDQLALLAAQLERSGAFVTLTTQDPGEALVLARNEEPDAVVTDLVMPDMGGLELTRALRREFSAMPILVLTGKGDEEDAERAYEAGANDFVTKPIVPGTLVARLRRAIDEVPSREFLIAAAERHFNLHGIIGSHPRLDEVRHFIDHVAEVPGVPALVLGESGTGKNLVARAIHAASRGATYRFVEVNCAALPESLLEPEIFGYEKGAFTDAKKSKRGLAELADGGTLLLDEIGLLSPSLQAKLLTFLESRTFRRVGGTEDIHVDVRIVAATNVDLPGAVEAGRFREDLYYRLNVAQVTLPPLREIRSDIEVLARHFVRQAADYFGKPVPELDGDSIDRLRSYDWPGNVRELRNVIERALIFSKGETLRVGPLASAVTGPAASVGEADGGGVMMPRGLTLEEVERRYIQATLADTDGRIQEAADRLGVSRKVLWMRRKRLGLD